MENKKRPWYKRKTELGIGLMIIGEIMVFIPVTAPFSPIVIKAGMLVSGIGVVHRNIKGDVK